VWDDGEPHRIPSHAARGLDSTVLDNNILYNLYISETTGRHADAHTNTDK